tara:strand:- start:18354 stop:18533 length:180 start_codon:yes stop_codon:yes gene_type:complete
VGQKRFIAGAICPGCGAEDKVFVITEGTETHRGCSQCDFMEKLEDLPDRPDLQVVRLPE